ncbi:dienelactone hydrolase family protein [Polychaeton citri CBS 116435]|uniref:Dienelactone hydrolase family protein n=1 Tax=Polychaeton citri CBS 116435 TaxID=1314669 RepID=A0A9P4Q7S8_9PEZI|nr:dienelactone hydrolase family protein [Polychaeton citri CBS 116435]
MSCPQCFSGHVNPGTPVGTIEQIYGRPTYVSRPPNGKQALGVLVIIPDAFGLPFVNNQILADHYASAGQYLVYLPDFMDGGAVPLSMMYNMAYLAESSWLWTPYYLTAVIVDIVPHLWRNRMSVCWPRMTSWFSALREDVSLPIGAAGFCWGGLHAIMLTHDREDTKTKNGQNFVDASFAAHPSGVAVPGDFEKVVRPLSIAVGDDDAVMSIKQAQEAKQSLEKTAPATTEVVVYPGARHGFAVRASRSKPDSKETRQAEEAENQAIAWFQRHFAAVKH